MISLTLLPLCDHGKNTQYTLYSKMSGPQSRSRRYAVTFGVKRIHILCLTSRPSGRIYAVNMRIVNLFRISAKRFQTVVFHMTEIEGKSATACHETCCVNCECLSVPDTSPQLHRRGSVLLVQAFPFLTWFRKTARHYTLPIRRDNDRLHGRHGGETVELSATSRIHKVSISIWIALALQVSTNESLGYSAVWSACSA
jgi:hypothetical protein